MNFLIYSRSLIFIFLFLVCFSQFVQAQDYKSSIGGRLGTYAAVSFSTYLSEGRSLEAMAGITREANQSDFIFGSFYKFHLGVTAQVPTLNWYAGIGLYINSRKETSENRVSFAPAAIVGMEYTLEYTPVNFFIDVSPNYDSATVLNSKFNVHANLGVRYILSSQK